MVVNMMEFFKYILARISEHPQSFFVIEGVNTAFGLLLAAYLVADRFASFSWKWLGRLLSLLILWIARGFGPRWRGPVTRAVIEDLSAEGRDPRLSPRWKFLTLVGYCSLSLLIVLIARVAKQ